jgi:hypothetical protein
VMRPSQKPRNARAERDPAERAPGSFALDALGEGGWLKVLRLAGDAARSRRRPDALQQALFPYAEAL